MCKQGIDEMLGFVPRRQHYWWCLIQFNMKLRFFGNKQAKKWLKKSKL